ncbi:NAD-dependent epimerase/dehydratase family protein [Mastigocladopsis repens]|uniref:NAD-dependent epimerase/dehydratase family protein n=1 Tax=Mastigocladopsis repens TaxID=221287 RepID=UPI00031DA7CC|nr:NAD-dependent epimerase/dehydratase family protein [Mastigocladopsis repens]
MVESKDTTLSLVVTGADTELGLETIRQLVACRYQVTGIAQSKDGATAITSVGGTPADANLTSAAELKDVLRTAKAEVVLNLTPQLANTLLHDGQGWKGYDKVLPATTTALLEAVEDTNVKFLVHTSYAFLYGNATDATESTPLTAPSNDAIFTAAIDAEKRVINSKIPACVLRMGYLYGPQSKDLKLYVKSFKLGRPYFAGRPSNLANWLHFEDAAIALVQVAQKQPTGAVLNVVDGNPVSFADFIDNFAFTLGRKRPGHIPMWLTPLALILVIKPQQVELLELSTTVKNDAIRQQLGWSPRYANYREGLQQTVQIWRSNNEIE